MTLLSECASDAARIKANLLDGISPLEEWSRLSEHLGHRILAKRDDVGNLGMGGSKLRKLDLILGHAQRQGVDSIFTIGGLQSNHCRQTAAASARLGMSCDLYLKGRTPTNARGNLFLDHLFGANIHVRDASAYEDMVPEIEQAIGAFEAQGRVPRYIPLGGATPLGTLGYILAVQELANQLESIDVRPSAIIVAAGTGNTSSGIGLGVAEWLPGTRVIGVSVSRSRMELSTDTNRYMRDAITEFSLTPSSGTSPLTITDDFVGGGYTVASSETVAAVRDLARLEGVLVDATYTGKALQGLMSLIDSQSIPENPVVFWHTGGQPELFARKRSTLISSADIDYAR